MTFEAKSTSAEYDFCRAIVADLVSFATLRASSTAFDQREIDVITNIMINLIISISIIFRGSYVSCD